jgi:hypothetical protein
MAGENSPSNKERALGNRRLVRESGREVAASVFNQHNQQQ